MHENLFNGDTFDVVTKNYTVKEIIDIYRNLPRLRKNLLIQKF